VIQDAVSSQHSKLKSNAVKIRTSNKKHIHQVVLEMMYLIVLFRVYDSRYDLIEARRRRPTSELAVANLPYHYMSQYTM
jgi:hypothetical protein